MKLSDMRILNASSPLAVKFLTPVLIGKQQLVIPGNPLVMAAYSGLVLKPSHMKLINCGSPKAVKQLRISSLLSSAFGYESTD